MKFTVSIVIIAVIFLTIAGTQAFANGSGGSKTRVRGNIYDAETGPLSGLNVAVTCEGVTRNAVTTFSGLYVVDFTLDECDKFAPVTATVSHDREVLTRSVLVSAQNTATMDFLFGAASVPELGMIPGILAVLGSGFAYLGLKRKFI
ncbi:hypothetical protein BH09PAT2_BH09PAT2_01510 [soil metagenome]